jgi:hypothetical protein
MQCAGSAWAERGCALVPRVERAWHNVHVGGRKICSGCAGFRFALGSSTRGEEFTQKGKDGGKEGCYSLAFEKAKHYICTKARTRTIYTIQD